MEQAFAGVIVIGLQTERGEKMRIGGGDDFPGFQRGPSRVGLRPGIFRHAREKGGGDLVAFVAPALLPQGKGQKIDGGFIVRLNFQRAPGARLHLAPFELHGKSAGLHVMGVDQFGVQGEGFVRQLRGFLVPVQVSQHHALDREEICDVRVKRDRPVDVPRGGLVVISPVDVTEANWDNGRSGSRFGRGRMVAFG